MKQFIIMESAVLSIGLLPDAGNVFGLEAPGRSPLNLAYVPDKDRQPLLAPIKPEVIYHGSRAVPKIVLTFDACMAKKLTGYDKRIVDTLMKTRTPATFFLGGRWIEAHPREAKFLGMIPFFELANHSYSHPLLTKLPDKSIADEIRRTQELLYASTGRRAVFFRAPFGRYNRRVAEIAASMGLKLVQWDVVSYDPDPKADESRIIKTVLTRARNGSIVIMHVNGRGWHTYKALPVIIEELRKKGYEFVSLSRLLETPVKKSRTAMPASAGKKI
jgi:peptidoglycan/xylan/chitin deacetylase (PgdA/CDA1 family)